MCTNKFHTLFRSTFFLSRLPEEAVIFQEQSSNAIILEYNQEIIFEHIIEQIVIIISSKTYLNKI